MTYKKYPGRLNKRAKKSYGVHRILAELDTILRSSKAIHYVKKQKSDTDFFPYLLKLQSHTDCNGECIFCPHKNIRTMFPREKMNMDLYKKIIVDFTHDKRAKDFLLSLQNEPLLDDKLFHRISFFQEHNIHQIPCVLSTNGTLLDKEMSDRLLNSGLDIIQISVNALNKKDFEKIDATKNYEELINNINYFLSQDLSKMGVLISFVKTSLMEDQLKKAVKKWRTSGFGVVLHPLSNRGGALKEYDELVVKRKNVPLLSRLKSSIIKALLPCCPLPFYQLCVLSNGKAILCTQDWERKTIIGDLNKQTIHEIWNSDKLNEIRLKIISGRYDEIAACKECSYYKTYAHI